MERDPQFERLADACVELTPYGVQVRYPSHLELDESDMECALRECRKIANSFYRDWIHISHKTIKADNKKTKQKV